MPVILILGLLGDIAISLCWYRDNPFEIISLYYMHLEINEISLVLGEINPLH